MIAAGAAGWARDGVTRQLDVIVGHIHTHEELLESLPDDERALIESASTTVRKAHRSVPVGPRPALGQSGSSDLNGQCAAHG